MTARGIEVATPSQALIERLAGLKAPRPLVITCYVPLRPQDRTRSQYAITVRGALQRLELVIEQAGMAHDDRAMLQRDFDRIREYLADIEQLPHASGLALFVSEAIGLFEAVPLSRVLHTRVELDARPRVAELLAGAQEVGTVVATAIDRTHARFFQVTSFEVRELPGVTATATRGGKFHSDRQDSPGWGESHFHHRMLEERRRHAAVVAEELILRVTQTGARGIFLGGPIRATSELLQALPEPLRHQVIGMSRLNPTAVTPAQIRQMVIEAGADAEIEREQHLVAELETSLDTGWAVTGARPTLRALARGQVRTLFLRARHTLPGFRCGGAGRLVISPADCQDEGTPVPLQDLVNESIEDALRQDVKIVMVGEPELGRKLNGFAALLRFR